LLVFENNFFGIQFTWSFDMTIQYNSIANGCKVVDMHYEEEQNCHPLYNSKGAAYNHHFTPKCPLLQFDLRCWSV
jgi:hypothetical protein